MSTETLAESEAASVLMVSVRIKLHPEEDLTLWACLTDLVT